MSISSEGFDRYLIERYQKQVEWYDEKAVWNKKMNEYIQIPIIILVALVPVSAALELKWLTIVLSALVAAGTGILKFKRFEELWHNYRTICETLKKEKTFYDFKMDAYKNAEVPEKLFVERVEALISKEHTEWSFTNT